MPDFGVRRQSAVRLGAARRSAAEYQLLQTVKAIDQRVLIGHELEVALVQAQHQLVLLQLLTNSRPCQTHDAVHTTLSSTTLLTYLKST